MYDSSDRKQDSVYSKRLKAGKRRTYFFDIKTTRGNDYFLTITESRKRMTDDGYDRHKIFLYKEDFHKFMRGLNEAVDYVKTELMPDFNFDAFNHDTTEETDSTGEKEASTQPIMATGLSGKSAFEGQAEMNGYPMEKAADLPAMKTNPTAELPTEPAPPTAPGSNPSPGHSEEVDRW